MMPFHPVKPVRGGVPFDDYFNRLAASPDWLCQAKIDGQRTLWVPDSPAPGGGRGVLWSRRELPILRAPQVREALNLVEDVLDGELVVGDKPTYYVFDLPDERGSLQERVSKVARLVDSIKSPVVKVCPMNVTWPDVGICGWEGVVFKRRSSKYVKGSSPDKTTAHWIKYRAEWLGGAK